ncbi:MAG: tectonin domain-containing protein, partial [Candidatus Brocadiia bacterium]
MVLGFGLGLIFGGGRAQAAPTADIYVAPNTMKIAPYTALFSGVGSTSDVDIVRWEWDFGDTGSADPVTDEGMLAAHRFDSADTYTVSLTVTDANGLTDSTSTQITVEPFGGTTYYVSSSDGNDGYDGLSPSTPWRTLEYAVANMGGSQNNPNRLLLKRGDYWLCDGGGYGNLHMFEPSILDAYGTGDRPMIEFTNPGDDAAPCMYIYNNSGEFGYGVILNNLHLYHAQEHYCSALVTAYSRGCVVRNCILENGGISGTAQEVGLTVEDCQITDCKHQGIFTSGDDVICRRTTIAGNGTDNILDHPIYWSHGHRWLIDDCVLDGQNRDQCNFATKLRAGKDILVRNTVATGTRNGFAAGRNAPDAMGEETDNLIFDRCISHHNGTSGQASGFYLGPVARVTIQNCLVYQVDPAPDYGIAGVSMVGTDGAPTTDIRIYNNTFYSVGVPNLKITDDHAVEIKNNIFFKDVDEKPGRYGFYTIPDTSVCTVDSDYNCFYWLGKSTSDDTFAIDNGSYLNISWDEWRGSYGQDANSTWDDPVFVDAANLDFHLEAGSPCLDAGTDLPLVWQDMDEVERPKGSAWDIGAYEKAPEYTTDHLLWGLNNANGIFVRTNVTDANPRGDGWIRVPGKLAQVSAGVQSVWGVNLSGGVFCRTGIDTDHPRGTGWVQVPGTL